MDKELGQKIDKDFDLYVEDFLTRDKNKGLKPSSLTPQEWQKLSESLAQKGVGLVSVEYNGREYYKFARLNTQEPVKQEVDLHAKIDKSFDNYLKEFLQTEKNRGFKQSLLTEQEWQKLNDELASSNVVMVPIAYNGYNLYKFAKLDKAAPEKNKAPELNKKEPQNTNNEAERAAEAKRQAEQAAEAKRQAEEDRFFQYKYPEFKRYGNEGFFVSKPGYSNFTLYPIEPKLKQDGYITRFVPTRGGGEEEYILVAIKREIAEKKFEFDGRKLKRKIDNSKFLENVKTYKGKEIAKIGNVSAVLEDIGSISGRGIVTVRIDGIKIPFYVSSGMAGKTKVPTGKWEVFWGIGDFGWFNKGSIQDILNHYGSPELKQIAEALDEKLGDPRDTELVMETVGRSSIGGSGIVAESKGLGHIDVSIINSGLLYPPVELDEIQTNKLKNIEYVSRYLKQKSRESDNQKAENDMRTNSNVKDLRYRASKNFEKYLNEFLTTGASNGLPSGRLTTDEWAQLNNNLKSVGVQLVPRERDGYLYYWFTKYNNTQNKTNAFSAGKEKVNEKLAHVLKERYPNVSDKAINAMIDVVKNGGDRNDVYSLLRYKQDGEYTDVSRGEFENAFNYAIKSAYNGIDLISNGNRHHWAEAIDYVKDHDVRYIIDAKWPKDRYVKMDGKQNWTWFRWCDGNVLPPVKDIKNPKGFHISLNVRVTKDLLKILDDIMVADGGRYIDSYKFPKTSYYDKHILKRHDPVTIYISARNPELEKKIADAVRPFVRSNEGLIDEMLGYGVSISPETSGTSQADLSVGQQAALNISQIIKSRL